jgi:hypothetical protein
MVLAVHTGWGYNSVLNTRSRAGEQFSMSNNEDILLPAGSIPNISQITKVVMLLAIEAEVGALFL